jgi:hypothetical protein
MFPSVAFRSLATAERQSPNLGRDAPFLGVAAFHLGQARSLRFVERSMQCARGGSNTFGCSFNLGCETVRSDQEPSVWRVL